MKKITSRFIVLLLFCFYSSAYSQGMPPSKIILSLPANNASLSTNDVLLVWQSNAQALYYDAQVSKSSAFTSFVLDQSNISTTTKQLNGLTNYQTYYWRVRGVNSAAAGLWSDVSSFTISIPFPANPVLNSPANNATDLPLSLTLSWGSSVNAVN